MNHSIPSSPSYHSSLEIPPDQKFTLLYSPRTTYSSQILTEDKLFSDLTTGFDPFSIKILKKHFKERLGRLSIETFITILKNHLLSWHPTLPNRNTVLSRLLARLFHEIDLNNNGSLEWEEFTEYIIKSTNKVSHVPSNYKLQLYAESKTVLDHNDKEINSLNSEIVSYAFYIRKYNLIGIVHEGRSKILFFDGTTCKRKKCCVELKLTQTNIDILEINELNRKAELMLKKEKEDKIEKMKMKQQARIKFNLKNHVSPSASSKMFKYSNNSGDSGENGRHVETPVKVRKQIERINNGDRKSKKLLGSNTNSKLTVLTTTFINEYDLLLVSSTNNKISAWHYKGEEFKCVNAINRFTVDIVSSNTGGSGNSSSGSSNVILSPLSSHQQQQPSTYVDTTYNEYRIAILSSELPQYTMMWNSLTKHLYTGQSDGKILKWCLTQPHPFEDETLDITTLHSSINTTTANNVLKTCSSHSLLFTASSPKDAKRQLLAQLQKNASTGNMNALYMLSDMHERYSVSCLIYITKMSLIAASYYNGNIILWDPLSLHAKKTYNDQQTGIYQMLYDKHTNLLFTCGFDHDIYIYDPYIDNAAIYKLKGHGWSINSIALNESENELISMDILGNVKVWDTSDFVNFQTMNINDNYESINSKKTTSELQAAGTKKISSNLRLIYMERTKRILIYGNKFLLYEKGKALNSNIADDSLILGTHYNAITNDIITIGIQKIKLWSVYTGKTKTVYDKLTHNEITAYVFDNGMKRIYIGENSGRIANYNMSNGDFIKTFAQHGRDVVQLIYNEKLSMLISFSSDRVIRFNNDKELLTTNVIKEIVLEHHCVVKDAVLFEKEEMLVMGMAKGNLMFYDIGRYRFDSEFECGSGSSGGSDGEGMLSGCKGDVVACLCKIEELNVVFVCYESGTAKMVTTSRNVVSNDENNHLLIEFSKINCYGGGGSMKHATVVTVVCVYDKGVIYMGDRHGCLHCYNFNNIKKVFNDFNCSSSSSSVDTLINTLKSTYMTFEWKVSTGSESFIHLSFPFPLSPSILLCTSTDSRVKLFSINLSSISTPSTYIDELKQSSNKQTAIPIGIKYITNNPFTSTKQTQIQTSIIYRSDLTTSSTSSSATTTPQVGFSAALLKRNAIEKLLQYTKHTSLPLTRSTEWNYDVNISEIESERTKHYEKILALVRVKEKEIAVTEQQMQVMSIFSADYKPEFIKEIPEEQVEEFTTLVSEKIRNVKLAIVKSKINQYVKDDNEGVLKVSGVGHVSTTTTTAAAAAAAVVKKRKLKPIVSTKLVFNKANYIRNLNKRRSSYFSPNPKDNFMYYKDSFEIRLRELTDPMNKLLMTKKKLNLPKIKSAKCSVEITEEDNSLTHLD